VLDQLSLEQKNQLVDWVWNLFPGSKVKPNPGYPKKEVTNTSLIPNLKKKIQEGIK
jgi:hypothetical protein